MIFFDLDGTLLDHQLAVKYATASFWQHFSNSLPYSQAEFYDVWNAITERIYAAFTSGKVSFLEQRRWRIRELFRPINFYLSDDETDAIFAIYLQYYEDSWALFDDVFPCLNALSGDRLGIISNGNLDQQQKKLSQLKIRDKFTTIVTSQEVGVSKPNPEIFLKACEKAAISPPECFYIGDKLDIDALASQAVGMKGIWLNREGLLNNQAEVAMIRTLTELKIAA